MNVCTGALGLQSREWTCRRQREAERPVGKLSQRCGHEEAVV